MTTPTAPLRIRIQSHAPLPILKLWFSIPSASTSSSLDDLSLSIHQFLVVQGLDSRVRIVLELQGFEFPPNALCSILDLANDVLDVKAAVSTSALRQTPSVPVAPPIVSTPLPVPPKATLLPAKRPASSSSSSSSSSDSDSDSDSDDSGPETASTGPPPAPNPNRLPTQPPPSKRAKVASSSSSSSSGLGSDEEEGEEAELSAGKKAEVKLPVPPGKGNKRTQARNARRRLLSKSNAAYSSPVRPSIPIPDLLPSPATATTAVVVASSNLDPYGGFDGPKLDMMHMAAGNKNKKKHIHVAAAGKKERVAIRTTFFPEASTSSSILPPTTPVVQTPTKSTPSNSTLYLNPTDYALQCPSGKTNLPPNIVVTRVNVEATGWVPGLGEVVPGTSRDYVVPPKRIVAAPVVGKAPPVAIKGVQERKSWASGAWPRASDLESVWDSLRILPKDQGKEGDRVAVKILELGSDYTPTITFKYGSLILAPKNADDPSEPDACIRLHSDCYADANEETYEEEQPYWMTPKPKFGQPIEDEEQDSESDPSMFFVEWDQTSLPSSSSRSLGSRPRHSRMGNGETQSARLAARQAAKGSQQHVPSQPQSSSASPPATIHDLPPEIIERVIETAYSTEQTFNGAKYKARQRFLRSTSLVCREWTPLAQAELWKLVYLSEGEDMDAFVSAGPGLHPVKMLVLEVYSLALEDDDRIEAILRGVRGVHTLKIHSGNINSSSLCGPGLKDLKSLQLDYVRYSCQIPPVVLPFNLNVLQLLLDSHTCLDLLHALSQQESITSLRLYSRAQETRTPLLSLAPRLLTLDILGGTGDAVFLSNRTRLNALTVGKRSVPDVDRLPNSLHSLKVAFTEESDVAQILDLINSKAIAVRGLERLTVGVHEDNRADYSEVEALAVVEDWDVWREVEEVCRQKKIKLLVSGTMDFD